MPVLLQQIVHYTYSEFLVSFSKCHGAYSIKYSSSDFGKFVIFFRFNKCKIAALMEVPSRALRPHALLFLRHLFDAKAYLHFMQSSRCLKHGLAQQFKVLFYTVSLKSILGLEMRLIILALSVVVLPTVSGYAPKCKTGAEPCIGLRCKSSVPYSYYTYSLSYGCCNGQV